MREEFGAYLKAQRELRGVSLAEISNETKIPLRHLESLEGIEQDELPDEVFVKGYIKSYADSIGADVDEVLTAYDETVLAPLREEADAQRKSEESLNRKKKNIFVGFLSFIFIAGLSTVGYWFFLKEPPLNTKKIEVSTKHIKKEEIIKDEGPEKNEVLPVNNDIGEIPEITDDPKSEFNETDETIDEKKEDSLTEEAPENHAKPEKVLAEKKKVNNTAETGEKSLETKKPEPASLASENNVKENGADNSENSVTIQAHKNNNAKIKTESLHLVVKAVEESWFNFIVDGSARKDFILPAGQSKVFRAKESINVWIGNKKGTKLILNDKELELPESVDNVIRNYKITTKLLE